jgi:signal peptidase II
VKTEGLLNMRNVKSYKLVSFLLLILLVFALDLGTKALALQQLTYAESRVIFPFMNFTLAFNSGAAFSLLGDAGGWQRWFFIGLSIIIIAVLLGWLWRVAASKLLEPLGIALVVGGALGNLYDRVVRGYVIDFLDFHLQGWHWPIFNLADSAISIGAVAIAVAILIQK